MLIYCTKQKTLSSHLNYLLNYLCSQRTFSDIETKHGRNKCLLDIPDKLRLETVDAFRLFTRHDEMSGKYITFTSNVIY